MTTTYDPYASIPMEVTYGGPDKAVILQRARMKPYKCVICNGESDGRPFVDFGLDIEWYGAVYICGYCFVMVSNKLGYYSPEQFSKIGDDYKETLVAYQRLAGENNGLRNILGSMFGLTIDERDNFIASFREFEALQKASRDSVGDNSEQGQSDIGTVKQADEQRSDGISGTTGSNDGTA